MLSSGRRRILPLLMPLIEGRNYSRGAGGRMGKEQITKTLLRETTKKLEDEKDYDRRMKMEQKQYYKDDKNFFRGNLDSGPFFEDGKNLENLDLLDFELDVNKVGTAVEDTEIEAIRLKERLKRAKIIKKHYKKFEEKTINLLTYSEKLAIKRLHDTDPEQYSFEVLSTMFPLSAESAEKVYNSKFNINNYIDIRIHDKNVEKNLEKIVNGEIHIDSEMLRKIEIRNKLPFDRKLSKDAKALLIQEEAVKRPLGAFERLVASPERIKLDEKMKNAQFQSNEEDEEEEEEEEEEEDEYGYNIKNQRITLKQFEERILKEEHGQQQDLPKEVNYLLNMKNRRASAPDDHRMKEIEKEQKSVPDETFIEFYKVPKYKNYSKNNKEENLEMTVENRTPYLFNKNNQYEKPYTKEGEERDRIKITKKIQGAYYKIGKSVYDENGEFLYRAS